MDSSDQTEEATTSRAGVKRSFFTGSDETNQSTINNELREAEAVDIDLFDPEWRANLEDPVFAGTQWNTLMKESDLTQSGGKYNIAFYKQRFSTLAAPAMKIKRLHVVIKQLVNSLADAKVYWKGWIWIIVKDRSGELKAITKLDEIHSYADKFVVGSAMALEGAIMYGLNNLNPSLLISRQHLRKIVAPTLLCSDEVSITEDDDSDDTITNALNAEKSLDATDSQSPLPLTGAFSGTTVEEILKSLSSDKSTSAAGESRMEQPVRISDPVPVTSSDENMDTLDLEESVMRDIDAIFDSD